MVQCLAFLLCFWQAFRGAWAPALSALAAFSAPPAIPEPYRVTPQGLGSRPRALFLTTGGTDISTVDEIVPNHRSFPREVDVKLAASDNGGDIGLSGPLGAFTRLCR